MHAKPSASSRSRDSRRTVCVVLGTRPEVIKLAPVIRALRSSRHLHACVVSTGQHRQMLQQALDVFAIKADEALDVMRPNQDLCGLHVRLLGELAKCFVRRHPDAILVQGDTTTAYSAAVAGFYQGIPVGHVEAGLRSGDRLSPFPEEVNRRLTTQVSQWHFAPTEWAAGNLRKEGVVPGDILVTGNTVVDTVKATFRKGYRFRSEALREIDFNGSRVLLITTHRRESFGQPMLESLKAIRDLVSSREDVLAVFPVHLNPKVQDAAREVLSGAPRMRMIPPLDYLDFLHLMARCHLIISDSGGVQEEAPSFGKPVLVLRENTERPEAVEAGTAVLVGTDRCQIMREAGRLLDDQAEYRRRARLKNPFGDGKAARRIVHFLEGRVRAAR